MGRSPCGDKNGLKKGSWTSEEDEKLIDYIQKNGCGNWRTLPKNAGLQRCGKSCRLRWINYLRPDIKRGRFSFEEEETIIQLHSMLGNKWSAIAARLPGRTDNEIKNYWNTHIRKKLIKMGIDPVTHIPHLDLFDCSILLNMNNSQSQMNLSRLNGMQNLINPELVRLATSLFSSHTKNQENVLMQNQMIINSNNSSSQIQNHVVPTSSDTTPYAQIFDHQNQLMQYDDVQQLEQNFNCGQFDQLNEYWQQSNGSMLEDYVPVTTNGYYGMDQSVVNRGPFYSETSASDCNGNNNFGFQSILSTPNSSSPMPLHSSLNSTYIKSSCTTEDEREFVEF